MFLHITCCCMRVCASMCCHFLPIFIPFSCVVMWQYTPFISLLL
uniref:Uncharacterized protein n=1 Tax=Rhizophora mucronata TaxID=61149 RepID=A0A2P2PGU6_RHIMU